MADWKDVFEAIEERGPNAPQVRIYLLTAGIPPVARLTAALTDYEAVVPKSKTEIAFIRKMAIESEQQFGLEVERVAAIAGPLLLAESYLSCVYDNSEGRTQFRVEMRKARETSKFIAVERPSDLGR